MLLHSSSHAAMTGDSTDGVYIPAIAVEESLSQETLAVVQAAVQGLTEEQLTVLKNHLNEVVICVSDLRGEVADLKNSLQDFATQIIQDVKRSMDESQKTRRRRPVHHRERSDSMSSSSIYFTASAGSVSLFEGDTSEGGYSTANAESDYTDRETDRETDKEAEVADDDDDVSEEDEEDRSSATVLTLRQGDSQEEDDERDEKEEGDPEEEQSGEVAGAPCEELTALLSQSDAFHLGDASEKAEGFHLLRTNKPQFGENKEFLWRLARAYSDMYDISEDKADRKCYAEQGRNEAESALQKNGLCAECHKWFAVLTGLNSQYESMHGKLKSSHILKEHLDRAIALKDDDALCYYLLGRWCYEISTLGWLERKAAAALYETAPTSSLNEALENFLKAEELNPGFSKAVRLYIAKCHNELGNISEAKNWANLALKMPSVLSETDTARLEEDLGCLTDKTISPSHSSGDQ